MDDVETLRHTKWECKYHLVFIPKCRRETLYGQLRRELGSVFRRLAGERESTVEEGHLHSDHVHMLISIPPKYSVAQVVGYIKGKSAIYIARNFMGRQRNFVGQTLLGSGLLRFDRRRARRKDHSGVYREAEERGRSIRSTGNVQIATSSGS